MPNETPHGFTAFKERIELLVREYLKLKNPAYFEIVERGFTKTEVDPQTLADETKPILGGGLAEWLPLLEALLEVELASDKVRRSLRFLGASPQGTGDIAHPGAWVEYHADHWFFQTYAFLDSMRTLVCRCCRKLVKPKNKDWKTIQDQLVKGIDDEKSRLKQVRDRVAHGRGRGETLIPAEVWGVYVLAGDVYQQVDLVESCYESVASYQHSWYSMLQQGTDQTLATMEDILGELSKHAF